MLFFITKRRAEKKAKEAKKVKEDEIFLLIDPIVNYYYLSYTFREQMDRMIVEKITISDVRALQEMLKQREKMFFNHKDRFPYTYFIDRLEELLPVENSIKALHSI